jgi:hypothetical protein
MLLNTTPRASLLERAGAVGIRQRLVSLNLEQLGTQKANMIGFLRGALTGGGSGPTRLLETATNPHSCIGAHDVRP